MATRQSLGLSTPLAIKPMRTSPRPFFATQTQEESNWCWAAVTSALLSHLGRQPMTQCRLVSAWKGVNSCPPKRAIDEPASLDEILNNIASIPAKLKGSGFFKNPTATFVSISAAIDAGKPVPMTIAWKDSTARHCVCAFGHTTIGDEPALWIFDPWPAWAEDGNVRLRTVSSMRSYEQAPEAAASQGHWSEAYLLL